MMSIYALFDSYCAECDVDIFRGDRIFYSEDYGGWICEYCNGEDSDG
jgi:hypothetical protein